MYVNSTFDINASTPFLETVNSMQESSYSILLHSFVLPFSTNTIATFLPILYCTQYAIRRVRCVVRMLILPHIILHFVFSLADNHHSSHHSVASAHVLKQPVPSQTFSLALIAFIHFSFYSFNHSNPSYETNYLHIMYPHQSSQQDSTTFNRTLSNHHVNNPHPIEAPQLPMASRLPQFNHVDKLSLSNLKGNPDENPVLEENQRPLLKTSVRPEGKTTAQKQSASTSLGLSATHKTKRCGKGKKRFLKRNLKKFVPEIPQGREILESEEAMVEGDRRMTEKVTVDEDTQVRFKLPLSFYLPMQSLEGMNKRRLSERLQNQVSAICRRVNQKAAL